MKKFISMLLAMAMVISMVACASKDTPTAEPSPDSSAAVEEAAPAIEESSDVPNICKGIYEVTYQDGQYKNFISFHDDGIFYHSMYNAGMSQAGYWTLAKNSVSFSLDDGTKVTAQETVELTNFDGSPYNNDVGENIFPIYEDTICRLMWSGVQYLHLADDPHKVSDETAITFLEFALEDDDYSTIAFSHKKEYENSIDETKGPWDYDINSRLYTLAGSGDGATVVVAEDGMTAVYTDAAGKKFNLVNMAAPKATADGEEKASVKTFLGTTDSPNFSALMTDAVLKLYEDNTALLSYGLDIPGVGDMGATKEGEWSLDTTTYQFTVTIDGTEFVASPELVGDVPTYSTMYTVTVKEGTEFDILFTEAVSIVTFDGTTADEQISALAPVCTAYFYANGSAAIDVVVDLTAMGIGVVEDHATGAWAAVESGYTLTIGENNIPVTVADGKPAFDYTATITMGQSRQFAVNFTAQ